MFVRLWRKLHKQARAAGRRDQQECFLCCHSSVDGDGLLQLALGRAFSSAFGGGCVAVEAYLLLHLLLLQLYDRCKHVQLYLLVVPLWLLENIICLHDLMIIC